MTWSVRASPYLTSPQSFYTILPGRAAAKTTTVNRFGAPSEFFPLSALILRDFLVLEEVEWTMVLKNGGYYMGQRNMFLLAIDVFHGDRCGVGETAIFCLGV